MANDEDCIHSHRIGPGNQQLVIITQLLQMSVSMRHIDEMFLWLSHIIGQRLNVDVLQFWAYQGHITGRYSAELRAAASQDTLFPLHVVNNTQIAGVIKDVLSQQTGVSPQLVANVFSSHQANLLTRYNLHYWGCSFLSSNILLPPLMSNEPSQGAVSTPLTMAISLFTQPPPPHSNLLSSIKRILEQALSIAKSRGLLSDVENPSLGNLANNRAQPKQLTINELIPHRTQDTQATQADNPFASTVIISDKQTRRLYFAIDEKKSIAKLVDFVKLDQQEFRSALRFLLKHKYIQLHDPNGKPIDSLLFPELL
jgi:hypothetical protein